LFPYKPLNLQLRSLISEEIITPGSINNLVHRIDMETRYPSS
jgi:hypothetical protein